MKKLKVYLAESKQKGKKYMVQVESPSGGIKTVHFGASGYSDYTIHRDQKRKRRYINRHRSRETWNKSGINTAGFWSRWLLWGEPTITASKRAIARKFGVQFVSKPLK